MRNIIDFYLKNNVLINLILLGIIIITIILFIIFYKKIKEIYLKYKEQINYLIFGVLTTIINLATYYLLTGTILDPDKLIELQIANVIAWIMGVLFAYFTNRKYVFNSDSKGKSEFIKFTLGRVLTLIVDVIFMFTCVTLLKFNDKIMKIISNIIVIVLNYIISKFFVFIKNKD